tara:strand:- start:672 stop:1175 length:504 start_codon:yes stop_codon:yes gene_type:complete
MPKYIPDAIKLEAMKLFLQGNLTAKEIAEQLSVDGVVVKPPTIYAWAKKEKWAEQKSVAIAEKKQEIAETEAQRFARLQEEQLDSYTQISNKASREITSLHFDRALDAARAVDIGIKGQREVLSGMVSYQFVQDVLHVLTSEINDSETIQRIAVKLKTLVQNLEEKK